MIRIISGFLIVLLFSSCVPDVFIPVLKSRDYVYISSPAVRDSLNYHTDLSVSGGFSTGASGRSLLSSQPKNRSTNLYGAVQQSHQWKYLGISYLAKGYIGSFRINTDEPLFESLTGRYNYRAFGAQGEFLIQSPYRFISNDVTIRLIGSFNYSREFGDFRRLRQFFETVDLGLGSDSDIINITTRDLFSTGGGFEVIGYVDKNLSVGGRIMILTYPGSDFNFENVGEPFDRSAIVAGFVDYKKWNASITLQRGNDFQSNIALGVGYRLLSLRR